MGTNEKKDTQKRWGRGKQTLLAEGFGEHNLTNTKTKLENETRG